jgi:hypothetical protein
LEIKIEDYLTIDEMKDIIRDEFASSVAKTLSKETNLTRIIGNIAHEIVFNEVGKYIPNYKELLVKNVKQIIEKKDYKWEIFRCRDVWDKEEGPGLTIIKETLKSNKDDIKKRIEDAINNFDIKALISDYLGKQMEEVADEFSKISDFLYAISPKQ